MRALITGITGQDGSFLAELLLKKGYEVHGLVRRSSNDPLVRLEHIKPDLNILYGNLRDHASIERAIKEANPDEIYNLAAQSDVGISFKCPEETEEINYFGVGKVVNVAKDHNRNIRIYQASTSEMFGNVEETPQTEETLMRPVSPYGKAKLKAHENFVKRYREKYGVFVVSGILFNHESERRGEHFVTRKITKSLVKISKGQQEKLLLGNLSACRDWGYAKDYVEGMWGMLQQDAPEDYILASGKTATVRDFARTAGLHLGMNLQFEGEGVNEKGIDIETGKVIVEVNPRFYRPNELHRLVGDPSKAKRELGWEPKTSLEELIRIMIDHDQKTT